MYLLVHSFNKLIPTKHPPGRTPASPRPLRRGPASPPWPRPSLTRPSEGLGVRYSLGRREGLGPAVSTQGPGPSCVGPPARAAGPQRAASRGHSTRSRYGAPGAVRWERPARCGRGICSPEARAPGGPRSPPASRRLEVKPERRPLPGGRRAGGASVAAAAPLGDLAGPGQAAGPREAGGGAGGGRTLELSRNH